MFSESLIVTALLVVRFMYYLLIKPWVESPNLKNLDLSPTEHDRPPSLAGRSDLARAPALAFLS